VFADVLCFCDDLFELIVMRLSKMSVWLINQDFHQRTVNQAVIGESAGAPVQDGGREWDTDWVSIFEDSVR